MLHVAKPNILSNAFCLFQNFGVTLKRNKDDADQMYSTGSVIDK